MPNTIAAITQTDPIYPGYLNFTRMEDDSVTIHVRGKPETHNGAYICGHKSVKGEDGRCTAGDEFCNNYCNMAPEKGPMQKSPMNCTHVLCGSEASITLTAEQFAELKTAING